MFIYLYLKNCNAKILEITTKATLDKVNFKLYNQIIARKGLTFQHKNIWLINDIYFIYKYNTILILICK